MVVIVGTFMAVLDVTIVNVVLPQIMSSFGANVKQVQWVSTGFMIATAVSMPATGWLGLRLGLGRLYLIELFIFTVGSLLCAVAWNLEVLIFARVVQAIGAGGIMPTSMAIITEYFPPHFRGRAIGIWGVGFMIGPTIGPTSGGYLADWFSWRAVFAINLPIGAAAMGLAALLLPPGKRETSAPFDWQGFFALGVFLVAGLFTLDNGQEEGWTSGIILLGGAVTVVSFLLFLAVVWDAPHPVMPLRLFRSREYSLAMTMSFLRAAGFFGALFLLPIFLQNVQGRDTIDTGLLLLPSALAAGLFMPVAGMLTDRYGPRWLTTIGVLLLSYSLFLYYNLEPVVNRWEVIYPTLWRSIGVTLLMTPVNTAAMNAVPRADAGSASWMINLTMTVGGAFTIAMIGSLLYSETLTQMELLGGSLMGGGTTAALIAEARSLGFSVSESGQLAQGVLLRLVSASASSEAFKKIFLILGLISFVGLGPALFLSPHGRRPGDEEPK